MTVYYVLNQLGPHSKGDVLSFSPEQIGAGVDITHLTSIGAIRVASGGEIARAVPAQIQATHAPQGVGVFTNNGVPDSTSYAGIAAYGSLCWDVAASPPTIYVNTGTIATPVWSVAGYTALPGLTSDGKTPGGVVIAGQMTVGSPDLDDSHEFHTIHGSLSVFDAVGTEANDDDVILGQQGQPLTANYSAAVLTLFRNGVLNGFDYTYPMVQVDDLTDSAAPLARFTKHLVTSFQVDSDGVQVHDKFKTGASIAHTLGAYSGNAVPIYDESGALLGYMPLYA